MSRKRNLTEEDRDVWSRVAASARPLHPKAPKKAEGAQKPPLKRSPATPIPEFTIGERAPALRSTVALVPSPADHLDRLPLRMDQGAHKKMTRGKIAPEARIDLHGMTLAEAQPELRRFVLRAHASGLRLILVITGKGKRRDEPGPIPVRTGALRHQVPHWLHSPPLAPLVLQIATAHVRHGGEGAYYVYLRRGG
jgi:DNA-nicking Smr family endonuclease